MIVSLVHTKLGASDLANISELSAPDALITDHADEQLRAYCSDYEIGDVEPSSLE